LPIKGFLPERNATIRRSDQNVAIDPVEGRIPVNLLRQPIVFRVRNILIFRTRNI